jgi:hypothetical protein
VQSSLHTPFKGSSIAQHGAEASIFGGAMDLLSRSPDVLCFSRSRGGLRASVPAPFTASLPSLAGVLMAYIVRIYTRPWHPVRNGKLTRW